MATAIKREIKKSKQDIAYTRVDCCYNCGNLSFDAKNETFCKILKKTDNNVDYDGHCKRHLKPTL